jgi:drug/metabolite transporter (DMT)-like permease
MLGVVAVVALVIAALLAAFRRDRLNLAVLIAVSILGALIAFDLWAISVDFHDADGIFDCWPYCSTWQEVISNTLWFGALLVVALVISAVLRETVRNLRR